MGSDLPELSRSEVARYSRHLLLEDVGLDGQRRLKSASVLCVGSGGLGSPVLMYLAAAGVGRIGIVDFDVVDTSNLQRQIVHGTADVGRPKVHSARDRMREINPHVDVVLFEERITSENAFAILGEFDIVVDGTDNFPTRYLVNDACVMLGKPYIYGSIFKFEGQASVFNHAGGPNYRDLYPTPPPPGAVPSCSEAGVLGILPGIIGVIQATEVVKIILGKGDTLSGRLLLYDALGMRFRELQLQPDPNRPPIEGLIDYTEFCGSVEEPVDTAFSRLSVAELQSRRAKGWRPYVLDVRKAHEAEIVSLDFVDRQHPHDDVASIAEALPRDRDLVLHCKSGRRSAVAARTLASLGFERLFNLEGGILAWAEEIDPALATY